MTFLEIRSGKKKKKKILDVGCGTGTMLNYLAQHGQVEGIDNSKKAVAFCRQRGFKNTCLGDAQKLPFSDNSFDLVTAFDTLEHIEDDQIALKEFYRVLRPNGLILMTVPALPIIWSSHDVIHCHFRRYKLANLKKKLKVAKFEPTKTTYINSLLFLPAFVFRFSTGFLNRLGIFRKHTDLVSIPPFINSFLSKIFCLEAFFLRYIDFPLGITILVEAKKREEK